MALDIRILAFDLDDTTLDTDKTLRPAVAAAFHRAAKAGIALVPATGRVRSGVPPEVLALPGVRYIISSNGANVYDLQREETILSDCFDDDTAVSILQDLQPFPSLLGVYADGQGYSQTLDKTFLEQDLSPWLARYVKNSRLWVDDLAHWVRQCDKPVEKISAHYADMDVLAKAWAVMQARSDVSLAASMRSNIEVNTKTANKGRALLVIAEKLGFAAENTMAIGDNTNDIPMLEKAGYSVAMGNARDTVKAAADEVTLACDDEGVAHAVNAMLARRQ